MFVITPGATIQYSVYSRDLNDVGTYDLTVTATLNNYPYSTNLPSSASTLTVTVIDPCLSTLISTSVTEIENFVAFAGYSAVSLKTYTFNDTVTETKTLLTDTVDFCGEKLLNFSINGTETTNIASNISNFFCFSP